MKIIKAIYLILFKGYSVIRFDTNKERYGACNVPLDLDYGHNGVWGVGNTPVDAILDCYNKTKK
ncbi:hypothetical protein [Massilibacteroides sp.]|uniref:hypothetical protein n=1 Tax=Massilibacteroides sp. TaxID=2034766 RepID=UPI00261CE154|nr:hypothetical protein [Massilibacteroides sp.]MDD4515658.1 hypothetical protein [Massilibacteroides sp.]